MQVCEKLAQLISRYFVTAIVFQEHPVERLLALRDRSIYTGGGVPSAGRRGLPVQSDH